jgi:hypothetical protein
MSESMLLEGYRRALRHLEMLGELDDFMNEHRTFYKKLDEILRPGKPKASKGEG